MPRSREIIYPALRIALGGALTLAAVKAAPDLIRSCIMSAISFDAKREMGSLHTINARIPGKGKTVEFIASLLTDSRYNWSEYNVDSSTHHPYRDLHSDCFRFDTRPSILDPELIIVRTFGSPFRQSTWDPASIEASVFYWVAHRSKDSFTPHLKKHP